MVTILLKHITFSPKSSLSLDGGKPGFILRFTKIAEFPTELLETLFSDQELILKPKVSSKINGHVCNRTWTEFEQALEKRIPFPICTNHHLKRFVLCTFYVPVFATVVCLLSPTTYLKLFSDKNSTASAATETKRDVREEGRKKSS